MVADYKQRATDQTVVQWNLSIVVGHLIIYNHLHVVLVQNSIHSQLCEAATSISITVTCTSQPIGDRIVRFNCIGVMTSVCVCVC